MIRRPVAALRTLLLGSVAAAMLPAALAHAAAAEAAAPVAITVTKIGCEPASVTVPEGETAFTIKNNSPRALEWEILKGVMVVAERENILPGFTQTLKAKLEGGDYQMTCGLLSNPKGILTVAAKTGDSKQPPSPMDLVGPIAEYKVYVTEQVALLVKGTKVMVDAVKAGDLAAAKAAYAPARLHYERIEPIAELFSDLDGSMDAREDDYEKKSADPNFTGFHRLEKIMFADHTVEGAAPFADKLMGDTEELQKRLKALVITPKAMVGGAAELIEEVASKKISGEEDRYSRTDLWDFQANVEGAQKIVDLLRPLVDKHAPGLDKRVRENFAKVDALLAKYKDGPGFESYEKLTDKDRNSLKGPVTVLAEDLSSLKGRLGVE